MPTFEPNKLPPLTDAQVRVGARPGESWGRGAQAPGGVELGVPAGTYRPAPRRRLLHCRSGR